MEKATQSEMLVLALNKQFNDLLVKITTMEVDHNLELVNFKDRAFLAEEEATIAKQVNATLKVKAEEDDWPL